MSKQYVFWRKPTGQPYKGQDGQYGPEALLAKIGEHSSVSPDGGISWPFPDLQWNDLAARSAAVVIDPNGNELNEADSRSIVWEAMKAAIKESGGRVALRPMDVIARANTIAALHFQKAIEDYVLVTTLSVDRFPKRRIRIYDSEIAAMMRRAKYVLPPTISDRPDRAAFAQHLKHTKYLTVKVTTVGRTIHEASDNALNALNLLRGLWTLAATYGSWRIRMGIAKQQPIGVVHIGPVHTIHKPDGSLASDTFWFEPAYDGDRSIFVPKAGWEAIDKQRRSAVTLMKRHKYKQDIERFIIRYALALDEPDMDIAFLQMWSILESVTNTVGSNYDKTIQRATWSRKERSVGKELLEHLRLRRNQYVHSAKSGDNSEQVAYMIKSFVEPHLVRLIGNDFRVQSIEEYGAFLDLPTNLDSLRKQRLHLQRAIRIWSSAN